MADPPADLCVLPVTRPLCRRPEIAQQLHRSEQLRDERGAAFETEGDHCDAPAVILVADAICHRYAHIVQEELSEFCCTGDSAQWSYLDSRCVHRHDQPRDPAVSTVVGSRPHQELAEVCNLSM